MFTHYHESLSRGSLLRIGSLHISAEDKDTLLFSKVERLFFSPQNLKGVGWALWAIIFGSQMLKG